MGDLDLSEYLDRYRNQRLVLIIAPAGQAEPESYTCGMCGFVMNSVGDCPRCKLMRQAVDGGQVEAVSLKAGTEKPVSPKHLLLLSDNVR